ncbi:hypothetical protein [Vibrio marisflavi]|uniref:Uncharacterized protein n=1 Tax=Vibrio marisflavi CECT 7928 TaxID=634439 RepID=A0ABM9ABA0_9VIBR|nr:hypothetical protein [Vibrio marisflavi]CAH0543164.1 hypothetical protein VMF7928_04432 [Vibrio marisflavi CECT 7928]
MFEELLKLVVWDEPLSDVPDGWTQKQTIIENWFVKVWHPSAGTFEASATHMIDNTRHRLGLSEPKDMDKACNMAAEIVISTMITSAKA